MGHDVRNIGQHNLDISSIEALANDLSKRVRANIVFGYYDEVGTEIEGKVKRATNKFVLCGEVDFPNSNETLTLTENNYQLRKLIEKHGSKIYDFPYFKKIDYKDRIDEAIKGFCFELYDDLNDTNYGTIYNNTFHDWYNYYNNRWWSFCRAFTEDNGDMGMFEYVNAYRKEVMSFFKKIGGETVFYFDDQGESQYLTYDYYDWETILKVVETNFKETTIRISEFMKKKNLLPRDEFPLVFYDDFADLKTKNK